MVVLNRYPKNYKEKALPQKRKKRKTMTKIIKTVIIEIIGDIFKELDKPNPDTTYVKSLLNVILTVLK